MTNNNPEPSMVFAEILSDRSSYVSQSVTEFRRGINDATEKSPEAAQDALWSSWKDFSKIVAVTKPEDQDRLIQFLVRLREDEGQENGLQSEGEKTKLSNLPLFGQEMRYVWNEAPDEKSSTELARAWVNRNAFAARITALSKPDDCLDYSLYCIWSMRDALEDHPPEEKTLPAILKAAAMWMIYAPREIYQRAVDGQVYDGRMGIGGRDVEGKDWKGHSKERWQNWSERLKRKYEGTDDEETRKVIEEALEKMAQVKN